MPAGRPPLPDDERRDSRLHIRLTASEMDVIQAAAEADGKAASDWARDRLVAAAKRKKS